MNIYPAIDIRGGKVVRLTKGDYAAETVYADDPAQIAQGFEEMGAEFLHVVDLDGAKDGTLANFDKISGITSKTQLRIEVGGGIRDMERVKRYLDAGAFRVIIGTAAVSDPDFLEAALREYGERIAVGVDALSGYAAVQGWRESTNIGGIQFCESLRAQGVKTVIYTDIEKDGMLSGPNFEVYERLSEIAGLDVIASGGVSSLDDLRQLRKTYVSGAIIGKALYTGAIDLREALRL